LKSEKREVNKQMKQAYNSMIEISHADDENLENQIELSGHENDNSEDEEDNELEMEHPFEKLLTIPMFTDLSTSQNNPSKSFNSFTYAQGNECFTAKDQTFFQSNPPRMTPIDTIKLAKTICNILKDANIPQALFANEVLCIQFPKLSNLLYHPKPWAINTNYNNRLDCFKK
jgi:hypothetical protein